MSEGGNGKGGYWQVTDKVSPRPLIRCIELMFQYSAFKRKKKSAMKSSSGLSRRRSKRRPHPRAETNPIYRSDGNATPSTLCATPYSSGTNQAHPVDPYLQPRQECHTQSQHQRQHYSHSLPVSPLATGHLRLPSVSSLLAQADQWSLAETPRSRDSSHFHFWRPRTATTNAQPIQSTNYPQWYSQSQKSPIYAPSLPRCGLQQYTTHTSPSQSDHDRLRSTTADYPLWNPRPLHRQDTHHSWPLSLYPSPISPPPISSMFPDKQILTSTKAMEPEMLLLRANNDPHFCIERTRSWDSWLDHNRRTGT